MQAGLAQTCAAGGRYREAESHLERALASAEELSPESRSMPDILQRVACAVIARSPIERLAAFKKERGWRFLRLYSSGGNTFNRDYADEDPASGSDNAGFNVFTRRDGVIRHTWGDEMGPESADPGQDPRGAPEVMPIWIVLDMTPGGRGVDWYPELDYPQR